MYHSKTTQEWYIMRKTILSKFNSNVLQKNTSNTEDVQLQSTYEGMASNKWLEKLSL